ncbi:MAG: hypothetical protein BECKG1743D_GA0114223_101567, partial [Candidatus Kentron sp. G]
GSEVKGSWTPYFGFFSPINLKPNKSHFLFSMRVKYLCFRIYPLNGDVKLG